ncbi:aromatic acid exporter family protein [Paenibacillus sp. y28]|uniref:aromatic acid exporter family protein n=1 Tax=Paenibacillus sp. y28 TaxID=3129110 RepID=UPI00301A46C1
MGIRVLKTALASVIAVYAAGLLGLQFASSAGLLAILGVDVTRKKSLKSVSVRFAAALLGLFVAVFLFMVFGYHAWVIGLYIVLAYPVLSRVHLRDGMINSSVIMFHVYSARTVAPSFLYNEILLLVIGLGSAVLVNLAYMPKLDKQLLEKRHVVEGLFSVMFTRIAEYLDDHSRVWSGKELISAEAHIGQGVEMARKAKENHLFAEDSPWLTYFLMRSQQLESIQRMMMLVSQVDQTLDQGRLMGEIFRELSEDVKSEHYTGQAEHYLEELRKKYKQMPLPASRAEFEARSALLQLGVELRLFLSIARKEKKRKPQHSGS